MSTYNNTPVFEDEDDNDITLVIRDNRGGNWFWIHNIIIDHYQPIIGTMGFNIYSIYARQANNKTGKAKLPRNIILDHLGIGTSSLTEYNNILEWCGLIYIVRGYKRINSIYLLQPRPITGEWLELIRQRVVEGTAPKGNRKSYSRCRKTILKRLKTWRSLEDRITEHQMYIEQKIQTIKAKDSEKQLTFLKDEDGDDSAGGLQDSAGGLFKQDSTTRLKQDSNKTQQQEVVAVLFSEIGIIEPVFSELINSNPIDVEGWLIYTENNLKIEDPAGFVITKLRNNEKPPHPQNGKFGHRTLDQIEAQAHANEAEAKAQAAQLRTAGVSQEDVANWKATLQTLQTQTTNAQFSWLKNSQPIRRNNQTLIIGLKSQQAVEWTEARLIPVIERAASNHNLTNLKFEVEQDA